jgi:hypothetical protein
VCRSYCIDHSVKDGYTVRALRSKVHPGEPRLPCSFGRIGKSSSTRAYPRLALLCDTRIIRRSGYLKARPLLHCRLNTRLDFPFPGFSGRGFKFDDILCRSRRVQHRQRSRSTALRAA